MKRYYILIAIVVIFGINFIGCSGCPYSFTGASVPPHLKTLAIPFVEDKSGSGEANLRESFTRMITQKFIDDNSLRVGERNSADAILECIVTGLSDAPQVITSGENVSGRRVTLSVNVVYRDLVKKKLIYEKQFSNYGDYLSADGRDARTAAIQKAIEKITDDILLDTISGW